MSEGVPCAGPHPLYTGPPLEEISSGVPVYPSRKVMKDIWGTYGESVASYYEGIPRPPALAETVAEVDLTPGRTHLVRLQPRRLAAGPARSLPCPMAEWAKQYWATIAGLAGRLEPDISARWTCLVWKQASFHVADPSRAYRSRHHFTSRLLLEEHIDACAAAGRGCFEIIGLGRTTIGQPDKRSC